ncbi:MAG: S-layer homology domain-containing protein, partial [Cyanobacteria bacterium J06606_4]
MFKDVPATHWAKDYIETLGNMEILSGFPDGTFLPDEPVTRAQFATIVNKAFLSASSSEGSPEASQAFADVPADHWALDAINATRTSAFLFGYPGNLFRPEQNISRVQTLVSLVNGLNYTGGSIEALPYYKDAKDIPDYAKAEAVAA